MIQRKASYIQAFGNGMLKERKKTAEAALKSCGLCPHKCGVDRIAGEKGVCRTGTKAIVCSFDAHFGEEAPLVGQKGSGTIFFSYCNLRCCFCQNHEISHGGAGQEVTADQLAWIMLELQKTGCHNINFVSPSHVVAQVLQGLEIAVEKGLKIPLVYNSGGYDSMETLKLLDGIVDIYMPDFKFWDPETAQKLCQARNYPHAVREAVRQMHAQVGDLVLDEKGIAVKGVLIRHLVLPEDLAGTAEIMNFIAKNISCTTYVNIMPQYRPCGTAFSSPPLDRPITKEEFMAALAAARKAGLLRLES